MVEPRGSLAVAAANPRYAPILLEAMEGRGHPWPESVGLEGICRRLEGAGWEVEEAIPVIVPLALIPFDPGRVPKTVLAYLYARQPDIETYCYLVRARQPLVRPPLPRTWPEQAPAEYPTTPWKSESEWRQEVECLAAEFQAAERARECLAAELQAAERARPALQAAEHARRRARPRAHQGVARLAKHRAALPGAGPDAAAGQPARAVVHALPTGGPALPRWPPMTSRRHRLRIVPLRPSSPRSDIRRPGWRHSHAFSPPTLICLRVALLSGFRTPREFGRGRLVRIDC